MSISTGARGPAGASTAIRRLALALVVTLALPACELPESSGGSREADSGLTASSSGSAAGRTLTTAPNEPQPGDQLVEPGEGMTTTIPHDLGAPVPGSLFPTEAVRQAFFAAVNEEPPSPLAPFTALAGSPSPPPPTPSGNLQVLQPVAEGPGLLERPAPASDLVALGGGGGGGTSPAGSLAAIGGGDPPPIGPPVLKGADQHYVLRYVCCAQLPIIQDPTLPPAQLFAEPNVVAIPAQNEVVAVFDDLPVANAQQLFVRVQRSGGQHDWGYFPLFWLHQKSAPVVESEIRVNASYMAIARGIREMSDAVFYASCNGGSHPAGGAPDWVLSGGDFECGEYPVGDPSDTETVHGHAFRFLTSFAKELADFSWQMPGPAAYPRFGWLDNDGTEDIQISVPFYFGPLATQARPAGEYGITRLEDPDYEFRTRTYWQSEFAQDDPDVRIHPMDWYFKTGFAEDAPEQAGEVQFSLIVNLPGFEVYSPWFEKEIVLWHMPALATAKEARTSRIRLGGMRMDELPLRIDGTLFLKTAQNDGGEIDDLAYAGGLVGVRFTDVRFLRAPGVSFLDGISVEWKKKDPGILSLAIDTLLSALNWLLLDDPFDLGDVLFWLAAQEPLRDQILSALQDLSPRLTQVFEAPRGRAITACDAVLPPDYEEMTSPFYAFYRICRDFGATLSDIAFHNPANALSGGWADDVSHAWANVNLGGIPWGGPDRDSRTWWCPGGGGDDCTVTFDRPWWARHDPQYLYTGGPKFHPDSYAYSDGPGAKVTLRAEGATIRDYWHFLQCLVPGADRELNENPHATAAQLRTTLQEECQLPALETVCELYGEGEDLEAQWDARWGYTPDLSGYTAYCAWAEELRNEGKYPEFSATLP
jgi:hypothetical protein